MNKVFSFNTSLKRPEGVGTWHYVDTPIHVEKEFGVKGKLPVSGKINGLEFSATLIPRGNGEHYIVLDKSIRTMAQIEVGDSVAMEVWKDESPREVTIPGDFQSALSKSRDASEFFDSLTYAYQKGYVDWVSGAKKEETRKNRIEKSVNFLTEKRKTR